MKINIYMKVEDREPVFLETCRNEESAQLTVKHYEHEDRRDRLEGYNVPHTVYFMVKA